jgi:hypothetical protein
VFRPLTLIRLGGDFGRYLLASLTDAAAPHSRRGAVATGDYELWTHAVCVALDLAPEICVDGFGAQICFG